MFKQQFRKLVIQDNCLNVLINQLRKYGDVFTTFTCSDLSLNIIRVQETGRISLQGLSFQYKAVVFACI